MGDVSNEPTMEEILSSIKRVIEDSEAAPTRRMRPPARPAPTRDPAEVLELSERAPFLSSGRAAAQVEDEEDEPTAQQQQVTSAAPEPQPQPEAPARPESILSQNAADASRGALDALSRLVVRPDVPGSDSLEGLVREMLRPLLREWLDANLPAVVEAMVAKEIARISGR